MVPPILFLVGDPFVGATKPLVHETRQENTATTNNKTGSQWTANEEKKYVEFEICVTRLCTEQGVTTKDGIIGKEWSSASLSQICSISVGNSKCRSSRDGKYR